MGLGGWCHIQILKGGFGAQARQLWWWQLGHSCTALSLGRECAGVSWEFPPRKAVLPLPGVVEARGDAQGCRAEIAPVTPSALSFVSPNKVQGETLRALSACAGGS